jgi:hypothetical protein
MAMCSAHFRLMENMPLWVEPMNSALCPFAIDTKATHAILQGTYVVPDETDEFTREFLNTVCKQNSFLLRCFFKKMRFRSIIFFFNILPVLFASCLDVFVHIYFPPWRALSVALLTTRISLSHT